MSSFFFSGSVHAKLDDKNRFVMPQAMRFGLVEDGKLEFTIAMGLGGCLAVYRRSDIEKIVEKFRKKAHIAKFQKFFTLFFSTLYHTTCDKIGRVVVPSTLKKAVGIDGEIVVAGVLNKIEIWAKHKYESDLEAYLGQKEEGNDLAKLAAEAFALLDEDSSEPTKGITDLTEEALAVLNNE